MPWDLFRYGLFGLFFDIANRCGLHLLRWWLPPLLFTFGSGLDFLFSPLPGCDGDVSGQVHPVLLQFLDFQPNGFPLAQPSITGLPGRIFNTFSVARIAVRYPQLLAADGNVIFVVIMKGMSKINKQ